MNAESFRCQFDRSLYQSLSESRAVKRANEHLRKLEAEGPGSTRRHLLGSSVRLSRRMASQVHAMADECSEKLELDIPLELYVFNSPQFNAACFKPEAGRLFVMFSSSLLERFSGSELRFVMGHELGHHVYRHHDIPIGFLLQGRERPNPKLALELFAWSRYAEISADRAGAHCANDFHDVASALFKLASGLTSDVIEFHLEDFLQQVETMQMSDAQPGQSATPQDWFSTHPFSPMRVKALQHFHNSELAQKGGISVDELEVAVQGIMSLMEPNYIDGRTDVAETMRRLLFVGAIAVANATGGISDEEAELFEKFFGKGSFGKNIHVNNLLAELPGRIGKAAEVTNTTQRMQVLRDLCIVARAEGHTSADEVQVLHEIADGLDVPRSFVEQTLEAELDPD